MKWMERRRRPSRDRRVAITLPPEWFHALQQVRAQHYAATWILPSLEATILRVLERGLESEGAFQRVEAHEERSEEP